MDNFHRVINLPTVAGWSSDMTMRLAFLREQQRAHGKLYFIGHTSVSEIMDFLPGKPYEIRIFDNAEIVHVTSEDGPVAFNTLSLMEHFTFLMAGHELAFDPSAKSVREAYVAADRWNALTNIPQMVVDGDHNGFDPDWREAIGNDRFAEMSFCTQPAQHEKAMAVFKREDAVSKLTDMADLMRARAVEEELADKEPALVTRLIVPVALEQVSLPTEGNPDAR